MRCRGMQTKHLAYVVAVIAVALLVIFAHVEQEITKLNEARVRLESVLDRMQLSPGDGDQRLVRAPASYAQDPVSPVASVVTDPDEQLVIYNRVPKTASTSFAGMAYELCRKNRFHVIHFNITRNSHLLSITDQMRFINNITKWEARKPTIYHGHIAYVDFSRLGVSRKPIYINIIRDPLDRLVSYYYFVRHGDDFRPHIKRRRSGDKQSFDECVTSQGADCDPVQLWSQIPFFCGHAAECINPGSRWALEQAKHNLVNNYLVVGLTEELGDFLAVLEAALPRFFVGATQLYNTGRKSHLRKTFNKIPPSEETIARIQESQIWKMENDFYQFAKEQFHFIKKKMFYYRNGVMKERVSQFQYEKIRPR